MNQIAETDMRKLKQEGYGYLPKNLETPDAQKQILAMLSAAVAPVLVCQEKAEREIWPKVEKQELPLNHAVAQCAYDADKLIGITIIENLKLQQLGREALLKAWIALDYYCYVLKPEFSGNIHRLQDHISGILLQPAANAIPGLPPIAPVPAEPKPVQKQPSEKPKKKGKPGLIIAAAVVALIVIAICANIFSPVTKTEKAIDAIGTVTMESESAVKAAEELYYELTAAQQQKVENAQTLLDARASLTLWNNTIQKAIDAIDAIGTVTLESGDTIVAARTAYDRLKTYGLTDYASHKLSTLERAETEYENLYVKSLLDSALQMQEEKNYPEAMEIYHSILKEYPNSTSVQDSKVGVMDCAAALAQTEISAGNLETAMEMLTEVSDLCAHTDSYTKAYDTLLQRLKQLRPVNGKTFKNTIDWGWGEFTVSAESDRDAFVKLVSVSDPNKYVTFYVQAGNTATVKVKDGSYIVKYTTGDHWYGQDSMFGKDASFTKADDTFTFSTTTSGSYVYYSSISITLYTVVGGDLSTSPITADSF